MLIKAFPFILARFSDIEDRIESAASARSDRRSLDSARSDHRERRFDGSPSDARRIDRNRIGRGAKPADPRG